ncbi:MAG: MCE family protein [Betaproteobacteria bacterium]|nr:MCE family protein [Betaproteobacteria bacterium]
MEPEAKYTIVGAAALILVALLAAGVMWLRSSGEGANASRYKIYFERHSLEGLEPRSYVTMQGMRVGSVTGFRFSSTRKGAVEVFISLDPGTPVRESTTATTERHLVTGLATVRLANATEDSPRLAEAQEGESFPVIKEGGSPMQDMSETITQLAHRADDTMRRLNATLTPENIAAFTEILDILRQVSRRADAMLTKADATFVSVGGAADELRTLAGAIKADASTLTHRYAALGADASASVTEIRGAVSKMSADVDRLSQRADVLLAGGGEDLRDTARAVRSAADALGAAAGRLRDPRQVIYGPPEGALGPGEQSR